MVVHEFFHTICTNRFPLDNKILGRIVIGKSMLTSLSQAIKKVTRVLIKKGRDEPITFTP